MGGAKEYEQDLERLMAPIEEKADRLAHQGAKQFLARAKAVGVGPSEILKRFESEGTLEGILAEIKSREQRAKGAD